MVQRTLLGGLAAVLLMTGGLFLYQGISQTPDPAADALPPPPEARVPLALPVGDPNARGAPPPAVPEAPQASREERRFLRYDRNRDGTVSRVEMMSTRSAAFRRLDTDNNNLLSFEEWAVATSTRFGGADRDRSGGLNIAEFRATAQERREAARSACRC